MKRSITCFKHFQVIHHTAYMHEYKILHIQCIQCICIYSILECTRICLICVFIWSQVKMSDKAARLKALTRHVQALLGSLLKVKDVGGVEPLFEDASEILKIKWESFYWCRFWLRRWRFGSSGSSDIWLIFFFLACSPILSHRLSVARLTWRSNGFSKALIFRWNDVALVAFGVPGPCPTSMASRELWHWLWVSAS